MSADGVMVTRTIEIIDRTLLAVSDARRITSDHSEYATVMCIVFEVEADGLIGRVEYFDEDQYGAAVARLHELGAPGPTAPTLENAATHLVSDVLDHARRHRWDEVRARYHDGFVRVSHRALSDEGSHEGADAMVDNLRSVFDDEPPTVEQDVVAIRGDHLALVRLGFLSDTFVIGVLHLASLAADGRCDLVETFDEDDLDAAMAELDARFLAGEGAASLPVLAAGVTWIEASRAQDVDALRALTAPGLVCVDHQPLGFGTLDRDGLLAATQLRFELSADDVVIVRSVQVDGPAVLALHYAETATEVRSRYEREALYVLRVDAEGLIDRWEVFAPDRYGDTLRGCTSSARRHADRSSRTPPRARSGAPWRCSTPRTGTGWPSWTPSRSTSCASTGGSSSPPRRSRARRPTG